MLLTLASTKIDLKTIVFDVTLDGQLSVTIVDPYAKENPTITVNPEELKSIMAAIDAIIVAYYEGFDKN
jgi:beta-glucosidase/6-phospho-beta-glucosidase/beta-galactosidase